MVWDYMYIVALNWIFPKSMIVPLHIEFERLSAVVVVVVVISGELCNLNAIAAACPALVIDCARCGCSELIGKPAC